MNKKLSIPICIIALFMLFAVGKILIIDNDVDEKFQTEAESYCKNHYGLKKAIRVLSRYKAICNKETTYQRTGILAFILGKTGRAKEGFEISIDNYENNFIKNKVEKILTYGIFLLMPLFIISTYKKPKKVKE